MEAVLDKSESVGEDGLKLCLVGDDRPDCT